MKGLVIQMDLFGTVEELEGNIFELYERTSNFEFKSHIQFINATSISEAEDIALESDPEYWKTKSVRPVNIEHVWKTFEQLHYSYSMCKSLLGLDKVFEED